MLHFPYPGLKVKPHNSEMKRSGDFDGGDACKCADEDAAARNGWGRKAIRLPHVQ